MLTVLFFVSINLNYSYTSVVFFANNLFSTFFINKSYFSKCLPEGHFATTDVSFFSGYRVSGNHIIHD